MKKYLLLLTSMVVLTIGCMKDVTSEKNIRAVNRAAMCKNWAMDSIKIGNGPRINARLTPALADDRLMLIWSDQTQFPQPAYMGYGIRYQGKLAYWDTAFVARVQRFQWALNDGEHDGLNSATLGGNQVTVDVTLNHMKLVQTPDPQKPWEQYQTIWLSAVSYENGMDGLH